METDCFASLGNLGCHPVEIWICFVFHVVVPHMWELVVLVPLARLALMLEKPSVHHLVLEASDKESTADLRSSKDFFSLTFGWPQQAGQPLLLHLNQWVSSK